MKKLVSSFFHILIYTLVLIHSADLVFLIFQLAKYGCQPPEMFGWVGGYLMCSALTFFLNIANIIITFIIIFQNKDWTNIIKIIVAGAIYSGLLFSIINLSVNEYFPLENNPIPVNIGMGVFIILFFKIVDVIHRKLMPKKSGEMF